MTTGAGKKGLGPTAKRRQSLALVGLVCLLTVLVAHERGSVERGNRLHRKGDSSGAAEIYRRRGSDEPLRAELHYNLGTALLGFSGSPASRTSLARGVLSADPETRIRALYNLGLFDLTRAVVATDSDSAWSYATAAVQHNRDALRLDPKLVDAKWNLSMARRMLDSLEAVARRRGGETSDQPVDADILVQSESTPEGEEDEVRDEAVLEGEAEAPAQPVLDLALSLDEAATILGTTPADAELVVQRLWGLESRGRWGQQSGKVRRPW
jgi:hypothetical protein